MINYEDKSIVSFGVVTCNLPDLPNTVVDKLSTDQKIIYIRCVKPYQSVYVFRVGNPATWKIIAP